MDNKKAISNLKFMISELRWSDQNIRQQKRARIETFQAAISAMEELQQYRDAGLTPEKIRELDREVQYIFKRHKWIPVEEKPPVEGEYVLLSFENMTDLLIGKYETDDEGGAFYIGDEDRSCVAFGLFVDAWMPLPEPYIRPDTENETEGENR